MLTSDGWVNLIQPSKFKDEYLFQPLRIKVKVGSKVTWTNTGKETHNATAQDGSWSTGDVAPGQTGSVTFDKPGTYLYVCKEHPWSFGQVVVTQ
jgi:plastocyanin